MTVLLDYRYGDIYNNKNSMRHEMANVGCLGRDGQRQENEWMKKMKITVIVTGMYTYDRRKVKIIYIYIMLCKYACM